MRTYVQSTPYGPRLLISGDMISEYVAAYGAWSPTEVEFFKNLLPENADVIEVGAHIGMHTVLLAKHCRRGANYRLRAPETHLLHARREPCAQ